MNETEEVQRSIATLVAERVMGWHASEHGDWWMDANGAEVELLFDPVGSWESAGLVAERSIDGHRLALSPGPDQEWAAMFGARSYAICRNPKLAICMAALRAAGVELPADVLAIEQADWAVATGKLREELGREPELFP